MKRLVAFAFLLVAARARAESEVAILAGYTTSGDIARKADGIEVLEVGGSLTWGLTAGHVFSNRFGLEASWAREQSALVIGTTAGSAELFDMRLDRLQGSVVYELAARDASIKPFVLGGLGATFLSADGLESRTKLSWSVGAGAKWFASRRLGARAQARYAPTLLHDSESTLCDPLGFCQGSLHQFELMGGVVVRF